jgi:glyoxylase-like metal-dependent hydrolase (beta-lactamase superfamily II)
MASEVSPIEDLGDGIYCVEARYISPGVACCYLMVEQGAVAVIETGTAHTAGAIADALVSLGLSTNAVQYIIPTHVHLDHAGGAGLLMQQYPDAKLVIHPRGARHMINPTQLIAGSKAVYGEEKFARFYGELIPVPEERVIVAEDGDKIQLEGRSLEFRHTPGHAEHHFCVWDARSEGWFSGDTFGISYLTMGDKQGNANRIGRFIIPTTSPVQFDPDKLLASINLMMSYGPKRFYLTHYSVLEQPEQQAELLRGQIEDYRQIALSCAAEPEEAQEQQLFQAIREKTLNRIASTHPALNLAEMEKVLTMDFELNAQGLKVWLAKQK